jgi:hypothetical protein
VPRNPLPDSAAVGRALEAAFARPELAPPSPSPLRVWLAGVWNAFWEWVRGFFPGLQVGTQELRVLSYVVIALLVIAAVVVLLFLAGVAGEWWTGRERRAPSGSDALRQHDADEVTGAEGWEAFARRAAERGEWRTAVLALYQALLLRLDEHGALRYDAAKTPGDYRREVRSDPALGRAFEAFLRGFEPVAFGTRPLDGAAYGRLRVLAGELGARG